MDSCFVIVWCVVEEAAACSADVASGNVDGGEHGGGDLDLESRLVLNGDLESRLVRNGDLESRLHLMLGDPDLDRLARDVIDKHGGIDGAGLDFNGGNGLVVESGWW